MSICTNESYEFWSTFACVSPQNRRHTFTYLRFIKLGSLGKVKNSGGDNKEKPEEQPQGPKFSVNDFYEKADWSGLFDFIDVNGDGSLSWHEFLNVDGIKNCTDLMAKVTTFRDADIDGDDKVTKEEFIAHMGEFISRRRIM